MFTFIIVNRNLITWPKNMIKKIESLNGISKIIIVDNNSDSPLVLEWYKNINHLVIHLTKNVGHTSPWLSIVMNHVDTEFYFVSDPDLKIDHLPKDTLFHLASILSLNPNFKKVGLGLYPPTFIDRSQYKSSYEIENFYNNLPIYNNLFYEAPIDTTFAVYNKHILNKYEVCGVRTIEPYKVYHLPWINNEVDSIKKEYNYYLNTANASTSLLKYE